MEDVITENIIVEAKIANEFNLDMIAEKLVDAKYNPDNFPGVIINFPGVSTILTKEGKFICTGTKTMDEAKEVLAKIVDMLREKGIKARKRTKIEVKNLIISKDTRKWIDIKRLAFGLDNVDYNPDEFPGAIYRGKDGLIALVFDNGKIVCTGSNDRGVLEKFLEEVVERAREVG
ncbi:MAG TPA: hypothetical protein ENF40_00195 [Thermoplasmatales archaeon]|nr:hypothetical protein [Thermoplasmatales archaeon]